MAGESVMGNGAEKGLIRTYLVIGYGLVQLAYIALHEAL